MDLLGCQHRRMKSSVLSSGKNLHNCTNPRVKRKKLKLNPNKAKLHHVHSRRLPEFKFWYSATKATVGFFITTTVAFRLTTFILGYCILLYLFPSFQHPGVLADPRHVLHHPLLHHYEETDQGIGFI